MPGSERSESIAAAMPNRDIRLTVLLTHGGLDVSVSHDGRRPGPDAIAALAQIAAAHRIARITVNGEALVEHAAPTLSFAGASAVPPPGAFVQAAQAAELEISRLVVDAVGRSKRVADLFCGIGTFTLPLARLSRVLAVDGDQAAIAALDAAARRAQGLKPIETKLRDLFREPLSARELKDFDAVVFDPPRAGAKAQAERLAQSPVPLVVAVSCDPGTLARDLRILVDGGYSIEAVTPIDQFLFSGARGGRRRAATVGLGSVPSEPRPESLFPTSLANAKPEPLLDLLEGHLVIDNLENHIADLYTQLLSSKGLQFVTTALNHIDC